MFRFTIRDVLWLTVVAGMAVGWGLREIRWQSGRWKEKAATLQEMVEVDGYTVKWHDDYIEVVQPGKEWGYIQTYD